MSCDRQISKLHKNSLPPHSLILKMVGAGSQKRLTFTYCTKLHTSQIIILISAILGTSSLTYITANLIYISEQMEKCPLLGRES